MIAVAVMFLAPFAHGSQNLNHIGCVYAHDNSGWHAWQAFSGKKSFDLNIGESRILTGAWTSEKPKLPNYAFCTRMIGTSDNDSVTIETNRYSASEFNPIGVDRTCIAQGKDVNLLSQQIQTIYRGSFAELEIDWTPPEVDRLIVREYFPLVEELDQLAEISFAKCMELLPTTP